MNPSDHFNGRRFRNSSGIQAKGLRDVLRWKLTTRSNPSPDWVDDVRPAKPPADVPDGEARVTLINHSTVLIQTAQANILTDPIWSRRASPVSFAGPSRHRAPGVLFEDLPQIHAVLLSHNHYDHLDLPSLRKLHKRDKPKIIVPIGVRRLLQSNQMEAFEMDWWDEGDAAGVRVQCMPAQHFSARGAFDRDRTLWGGYMLHTEAGLIYFGGDSGMCEHFVEIRRRCGSPRLALLPIGAFLPRWFMGPIHMDPRDAVTAHEYLGAETSIAIHHGTFQLADDSLDQPARELLGLKVPQFLILANGESFTLTAR